MAAASALRNAWAEVLDIDASEIEDESNFVELGGDSVAAMNLVEVLPKYRLLLDSQAIFEEGQFCGLLEKAKFMPNGVAPMNEDSSDMTIDPTLVKTCAEACSLAVNEVEDVYNPSLTSEYFFKMHQHTGSFLLQTIFHLTENLDPSLACKAFEAVYDRNQSLRSRFVIIDDRVQTVVGRTPIQWKHADDLETFKNQDMSTRVIPGQPATRYGLIQELKNTYVVWTALHSVMDGWTRKLLCDDLDEYLKEPDKFSNKPSRPSIKKYLEYVKNLDEAPSRAFWDTYITEMGPWTPLLNDAPKIKDPLCNRKIVKSIALDRANNSTIRLSTICHAAFGMVLGGITKRQNVVYLAIRASRTLFPGAESIMGSMLSSVPVRMSFRSDELVYKLLKQVQDDSVAMMRHEAFGWHAMSNAPVDPASNNGFLLFNYLPKGTDPFSRWMRGSAGGLKIVQEKYSPHFLPGFLNVYENEGYLRLSAEYDDRCFSDIFMQEFIEAFMNVLNQICQSDQATRVGTLLDHLREK